MLLGNGGDALDYLEVVGSGQDITRPAVPCVAVPTTAGTGAEVTANAVLAVPSHRVKASLRSPLMIPRVALVDPLLTVSCPPPVTAASGLDALTQCLEPFVSVQATPLTDGLAREGLRRAGTGLRAAYADGEDLGARTDMAMCSLLGGISLANAKLGAVHGLAGVIGGTADVPHGLACAALLVPVIEANLRAARLSPSGAGVLERYTEASRLLTGQPDASIQDGLSWIRETLTLLHVPGLATFGLRPAQFDDIATQDWPAAVDYVRGHAGVDKVQVIAHCVGSMSFLMAMLAGMKGVQSAVCSQLTLHPVSWWTNYIKSSIHLARRLRELGIKFNVHLFRHLGCFLYLRSHPGQIDVMRRVLGDTLRGLGVDEESVYDILLAATEACTNVLTHGGRPRTQ